MPHSDCGGQLTLCSEDPVSALKPPFYSARRALPVPGSLSLGPQAGGCTPGTSALLLCERLPSCMSTTVLRHVALLVLLLTETCCVESPFDIESLYQQYYITFPEMCSPQV